MKFKFINLLGAAAVTVGLMSCAAASEDLSSSSVKAEQKTVAVEAKTEIGQALQKHTNLRTETMSQILDVAQEYYEKSVLNSPIGEEPPIPEVSRSSNTEELIVTKRFSNSLQDGEDLSLYDIENFFKQQQISRSDVTGDEEIVIEISMQKDIAQIIENYNEQMEKIKPDVNIAASLDFVNLSEDGEGIVIGGDQVIYPNSMYGALTIELLNSLAKGVSIDEINEDMENIGAIDTNNSRGHYKKYSTVPWALGKIYYKFGNISNDNKKAVLEAMKDWENKTGFIKFKSSVNSYWEDVWRDTDHFWTLNIVEKNFGDNTTTGNCKVGYKAGINKFNLQYDLSDELLYQTTRHELGHAIGLSHEHQRYDRDEYVTMVENKTGSDYDKFSKYHDWRGYWEWKWEKLWTWTERYYEWKWVGGAWWNGGHWSGSWKSRKHDVYGWKAYWVQERASYTTSYDAHSVMHYANQFILNRDWQDYKKGDLITLSKTKEITDLDVKAVKSLYKK